MIDEVIIIGTGNVVEDMFDLDGNPIRYKTSDKNAATPLQKQKL